MSVKRKFVFYPRELTQLRGVRVHVRKWEWFGCFARQKNITSRKYWILFLYIFASVFSCYHVLSFIHPFVCTVDHHVFQFQNPNPVIFNLLKEFQQDLKGKLNMWLNKFLFCAKVIHVRALHTYSMQSCCCLVPSAKNECCCGSVQDFLLLVKFFSRFTNKRCAIWLWFQNPPETPCMLSKWRSYWDSQIFQPPFTLGWNISAKARETEPEADHELTRATELREQSL